MGAIKVLLVEDSAADAQMVSERLAEGAGATVTLERVERLHTALKRLAETPFDVVLLDLTLPDSHGLSGCASIRALAPDLPLIVLTGLDDPDLALQIMHEGAQDYLVKDQVTGQLLVRAMRYAVERSRVGSALRASEERYRMLFERNLAGVLRTTFEGRILDANQSLARLLGFASREEVLQRSMWDFYHNPEDRPRLLARLRDQPTLTNYEICFRRRDGSPVWVLANISLLDEPLSGPVIHGTVIDISERKRIEDELNRVSLFLNSVIANIPIMLFVKDAEQLRFERLNKAAEGLLGYRAEDLLGKNDYDFFPKQEADFFTARDREVLRSGKLMDIPEEIIDTRHGPRVLHTKKIPIVDENGVARHLVGISEDITERKRAEQALAASERRYRQLMEAALDAIVVADQNGRILLFNPAAERIFGYAAAEAIGQSLTLLMPAEFHAAFQQGLQRYLESRQSHIVGQTLEQRGRRKDGSEFPLEYSLAALDLGGEIQFLGAIRDLTERNRLRDAMMQNEKLASLGQLSAGIAHEINNPLAYIANNLAVLERDSLNMLAVLEIYEAARDRLAQVDTESAARAATLSAAADVPYLRANLANLLTRTREGARRVTRIVQSLRGLTRTTAIPKEQAHVPELVDMSLELIRGRLQRRGIAVEVDCNGAPPVRCAVNQLGQVILNLLTNAMHAIESTGRTEGGRMRITARRVDHELLLEVADNGCGIDPLILPRIFDPFFTTKPVGEGTGLGLSITHGIVTSHGGRIDVESQPGHGACFRIFLPLT